MALAMAFSMAFHRLITSLIGSQVDHHRPRPPVMLDHIVPGLNALLVLSTAIPPTDHAAAANCVHFDSLRLLADAVVGLVDLIHDVHWIKSTLAHCVFPATPEDPPVS